MESTLTSQITTFQWVSISLGSIGTILGVVNLVRALIAESFQLKVTPGIYAKTSDGKAVSTSLSKLPNQSNSNIPIDDLFRIGKLFVTITNLSKFPVYLSEVGIQSSRSVDRQVFTDMLDKDGETISIEPRQSVTVYTKEKKFLNPNHNGKVRLFVKTHCGREVKATSPAFKRWVEHNGADKQKN